MMGLQGTSQRHSWLSLVAETAGVSGATVARVEIRGDKVAGRASGEWARAIIQIQDDFGSVVGAVSWEGSVQELGDGVTVDVGCDLSAGFGSRVVGWIQTGTRANDPALALAPWDAEVRSFDPTQAIKLMLKSPRRLAISSRSATPRVAA